MTLMSWFRGIAPLWRQRTFPFLNNIRVGTACTPYSTAGSPCLSISTLMMRRRSPTCALSCSRTGCMALHGPHQVAKKSTNTSWPERITVLNVSIIIKTGPKTEPLRERKKKPAGFQRVVFWICGACETRTRHLLTASQTL